MRFRQLEFNYYIYFLSKLSRFGYEEYKKKLLLRCIHHFNSDLIYNMDHMRISGTETLVSDPESNKVFIKMKSDAQKVSKQDKAIRDGVINPQNYNFNQFKLGKFWCSQNATNQPKSTVELGYMCPRGLTGPPAVTLTK